jgi:lysophospholipid acyltransferase (LPLAT)-like uncharacterized protein
MNFDEPQSARADTPLVNIVGAIFAGLLRVWYTSLRVDNRDIGRLDRLLAADKGVVIALWHGKYVPLFGAMKGYNACAFVADSFRGRVVGEISRRFGYRPVVLPARRKGNSRARVLDALKLCRVGGFAVDGPTGPHHSVKAGAIDSASRLGFALLPVSVAANHKWVMSSRWDRMELPLPFARVAVTVGEPMVLPETLGPDEQNHWASQVEKALDALDRTAEERAGALASEPARNDVS